MGLFDFSVGLFWRLLRVSVCSGGVGVAAYDVHGLARARQLGVCICSSLAGLDFYALKAWVPPTAVSLRSHQRLKNLPAAQPKKAVQLTVKMLPSAIKPKAMTCRMETIRPTICEADLGMVWLAVRSVATSLMSLSFVTVFCECWFCSPANYSPQQVIAA